MSRVTSELPAALLNALRDGAPVLVLTVGADGFPNAAFTYALALDAKRVRLCVDDDSSTLNNLRSDARAALQIMAADKLVFLIKGIAHVVKTRLDAKPMPAVLLQLDVQQVKDLSWRGVSVAPLTYEWDAEPRAAMQTMEQALYAEMRGAEDGIGEHGSLHRAAW